MKFPSTVFSLNLSAYETGLFAYLYLLKNREYRVCITYSLLSRRLRASPSLLVRCVKNLEKKGLLSVVKRYFRWRDTFSHRNCYHLVAPMDGDPDLPLKDILSLPLSLEEKGVLLMLVYLAGEEGDTFMTANEILSRFRPRPLKAFKSLINKGYIDVSHTGVRVALDCITER